MKKTLLKTATVSSISIASLIHSNTILAEEFPQTSIDSEISQSVNNNANKTTQEQLNQTASDIQQKQNEIAATEIELESNKEELSLAIANENTLQQEIDNLSKIDSNFETITKAQELTVETSETLALARTNKNNLEQKLEQTIQETNRIENELQLAQDKKLQLEISHQAAAQALADFTKTIPNIKESTDQLNAAKQDLEIKQNELEQAKNNLLQAQQADQNKARLLSELQEKIDQVTKEYNNGLQNVNQEQNKYNIIQDELNKLIEIAKNEPKPTTWSIDVNLPSDAAKALKTLSNRLGYVPDVTVDDFDGDYTAFYNYTREKRAEAGKILDNHPDLQYVTYDPTTSSRLRYLPSWFNIKIDSDNSLHDIFNLSEEDRKIINNFTIDLVNAIRKEASLPPIQLSEVARKHAEMKMQLYVEKYGNVGLSGGINHDKEIIIQANNAFGVLSAENLGDKMIGGEQTFTIGQKPTRDKYLITMKQLLENTLKHTLLLILNDAHANWGHATNFLSTNTVGVALSPIYVENMSASTFMVTSSINTDAPEDPSERVEIKQPTVTPSEIESQEKKLAEQEGILQHTKNSLKSVNEKLTTLKNSYDSESSKANLTVVAQNKLNQAKTSLLDAQTHLQQRQEHYNTATKLYNEKQEELKKAENQLLEASQKLKNSVDEVNSLAQKVSSLKDKVSSLTRELEQSIEQIRLAEKSKLDSEMSLELLKQTKQRQEELKTLLAIASKNKTQAQLKLTDSQSKYKQLVDELAKLEAYYQQLLLQKQIESQTSTPLKFHDSNKPAQPSRLKPTGQLTPEFSEQVRIQEISPNNQFIFKSQSSASNKEDLDKNTVQNTLPQTGAVSSILPVIGLTLLSFGTLLIPKRKND